MSKNNSFLFIVCILFLVTSSLALAVQADEGCGRNDLRGARLGAVRDQGDEGWCWAFTAADLISYRINERASAVDIAVSNKTTGIYPSLANETSQDREVRFFLGGGEIGSAIKVAGLRGLCMAKDLSDDAQKFTAMTLGGGKELQSVLSRCGSPAMNCSVFTSLVPHLSLSDIERISSETNKGIRELSVALLNANCQGYRKVPIGFAIQTETFSMLSKINVQLNKQNIVGIAYKPMSIFNSGKAGDIHASSIVGSRPVGARCQYLIRNSWGKNCSKETSLSVCDKDDPGNYWVFDSDLEKTLSAVQYISN